ncbi:hypothetical protein ACJX0J_006966, partial [Zea mays]
SNLFYNKKGNTFHVFFFLSFICMLCMFIILISKKKIFKVIETSLQTHSTPLDMNDIIKKLDLGELRKQSWPVESGMINWSEILHLVLTTQPEKRISTFVIFVEDDY